MEILEKAERIINIHQKLNSANRVINLLSEPDGTLKKGFGLDIHVVDRDGNRSLWTNGLMSVIKIEPSQRELYDITAQDLVNNARKEKEQLLNELSNLIK